MNGTLSKNASNTCVHFNGQFDVRDRKPYALHIQCLPYAGLKEKDVRRLVSNLCKEMVSLGMKVSGE